MQEFNEVKELNDLKEALEKVGIKSFIDKHPSENKMFLWNEKDERLQFKSEALGNHFYKTTIFNMLVKTDDEIIDGMAWFEKSYLTNTVDGILFMIEKNEATNRLYDE